MADFELRLRLLGRPQIDDSCGTQNYVSQVNPLRLLGLLAVSKGRMARSRICEIIWGADDSRTRHSLNSLAYKVKAFKPTLIDNDGVDIVLACRYSSDFNDLLTAARKQELINNIDKLTGRLYDCVGNSAAFERWADGKWAQFVGRCSQSLTVELGMLNREGNYQAIIAACEHIKHTPDLGPLAREWLIRALIRTNQSGAAKRELRKLESQINGLRRPVNPLIGALRQEINRALKPSVHRIEPTSIPFVGRGRYLNKLSEAYELTQSGRPQNISIVGVLGIGKTRMLQRFLRISALNGANVIHVVCDGANEGSSYLKLLNLIAAQSKKRYPRRHMSRIPGRVSHNASEHHIRAEYWKEVANELHLLASERPLVIGIDDWHQADSSLTSFIENLYAVLKPCQLMVVTASRGESFTDAVPVAQPKGSKVAARHLVVAPLEKAEVVALTHACNEAFGTVFDAQQAELAGRLSEGRPLFLLEFLRRLARNTIKFTATSVNLSQQIQREIRLLPESLRFIVDLVALSRDPLTLGVLADASDTTTQEVLRSCRQLRRLGFASVSENGIGMPHSFIRDAILAEMAESDRPLLNQLLARALLDSGRVYQGTLGELFERSGDFGSASRCYVRAAREASAQHAHSEADALLQRAIDIAPTKKQKDLALFALAAHQYNLRRYEAAASAYTRLLTGPSQLPANAITIARVRQASLDESITSEDSEAILNEVEQKCKAIDDEKEKARLIRILMDARSKKMIRSASPEQLNNGFTMMLNIAAEQAGSKLGCLALIAAARVTYAMGATERGYPLARAGLTQARLLQNRGIITDALGALAVVQIAQGDAIGAEATLREALATVGSRNVAQRHSILLNYAVLLMDCGDYERSEILLKANTREDRGKQSWYLIAYDYLNLAMLYYETNQLERAWRFACRSVSLGSHFHGLEGDSAIAIQGLIQLRNKNVNAARQYANLLQDTSSSTGDCSYVIQLKSALLEIDGRAWEALQLLEQASQRLKPLNFSIHLKLELIRAKLLRRLGDKDSRNLLLEISKTAYQRGWTAIGSNAAQAIVRHHRGETEQ